MDKTRGTGALLAVFLLGVMAWPATAAAGEMTWQVKSLYRHQVQIEFYSQDRKRAWPGGNRAYRLDDYEDHSFSLSCNTGEKICYGAWVVGDTGTHWGVGMNDRHSCSDCCSDCDGDTYSVRLGR